jgi:thiol-disulfide isomerase/thioredoxin
MPTFLGSIDKALRRYYTPILIICLLAGFGYLSYYIATTYLRKKKKTQGNDDPSNKEGSNTIESKIILYHTDWCPHSKSIMPEWNLFKEQYNNAEMNGYKLKVVDINLTNEDGSKENDDNYMSQSDTKRIIEEGKIEEYPTVKLFKDDETINFDARVTVNNLEQMIETILN